MKSHQLLVIVLLIIGHQSKSFDSTLIIPSKQGVPKEFASACSNQLPASYYENEEDNLRQIKEEVLQDFKIDPKHFILKLVYSAHGHYQEYVQQLTTGVTNSFKDYLSGLQIAGFIVAGIIIYWICCVLQRFLFPESPKTPLLKIPSKHVKILLQMLVIVSLLGALLMLYGLYKSNSNELVSTVLCKTGSIDLFQSAKDIQDYDKNVTGHFNKMNTFVSNENYQYFAETIKYSKQLLKAAEQSAKVDQKLIKQLKQAIALLQDSFKPYGQFREYQLKFITTIAVMSSRLNNVQIYKHFMTKDFDKQVPIADLPNKIGFCSNLLYIFFAAAFAYVAIVGALLLFKNKKSLFKKSFLAPYFLILIAIISFSIALVSSIIVPSVVLWNKSVQNYRVNNQQPQNFPKTDEKRIGQYQDVVQFIKIMFNKNYNIENIANGQAYRSTVAFNKALSAFELKKDDDFIKLFKAVQSQIDLAQLQKITNFLFMQYLQFDLQFTKQLITNSQKAFKATSSILQEQLLNKPNTRIRNNKIQIFGLLEPAEKALIIESQRARSLFKTIGFIALFALICQILIQRNFSQANKINKSQSQEIAAIKNSQQTDGSNLKI